MNNYRCPFTPSQIEFSLVIKVSIQDGGKTNIQIHGVEFDSCSNNVEDKLNQDPNP